MPTRQQLRDRIIYRHRLITIEEERLRDERDWLYILGGDLEFSTEDGDDVHMTMLGRLLNGP